METLRLVSNFYMSDSLHAVVKVSTNYQFMQSVDVLFRYANFVGAIELGELKRAHMLLIHACNEFISLTLHWKSSSLICL